MTERKPAADGVIAAMMAQAWLIMPDLLATMLAIAERSNMDVEALEKQRGEQLQNTREVTIRDGIATIEATGPMIRYASIFSRISGATSYETLATDFNAAIENPKVKAIVLAINSGGGQVDGNLELSDMVFAARGVKPITAYVSHMGASAAYRLAAAADEIVASPEAILGSIGVVLKLERNDPKSRHIDIVSTQSPRKRLDPESQEGQAEAQTVADSISQTFIESIAKYRDVTPETVLKEFGGGGVFVGQAAVDAGLADRLGSYEGVLADLRARLEAAKPAPVPVVVSPVRRPIGARASTSTENQMADSNSAGGATATPPATTTAPAAAPAAPAPAAPAAPAATSTTTVDLGQVRAEAQTAERKRIADISALKKPGNETLILACIDDANCSVDAAKARLYDHERATAAAKLGGLRADERTTAAPTSTAAPASSTVSDSRAAGKAAAERYRSLTSNTRSTKTS